MTRGTALALLFAAMPVVAQDGASVSDLRTRLEGATVRGLSAREFEKLADEGLRLAGAGGARREFWSAMAVVAELCAVGPFVDVRSVRARALELLAQRDTDTARWSSLVTRSFLPAFAGIPRGAWASELAGHDGVLDALVEASESDRVRAELTYAKACSRIYINRRWDWLSEAQRRQTLELLADVEGRFGNLPVPGTAHPESETVGRRARQDQLGLTRLYFGAPAPPTAGVDLDNVPLALNEHRGSVVVLDFWTSFCQPCLALVPGVRDLLVELEGEPVVYLGVCGDPDRGEGAATAKRVGMTWRNLWDGPLGTEGPAAKAWDVAAVGWPSVFVIDAEGRIRHKLLGKACVEAELDKAVRTLLAERAK